MSLKQFFKKARRGRTWGVNRWNEVRCATGFCPLGAVLGDESHTPGPRRAAARLGLRVVTAEKIAAAADGPWSAHRPWLLKNLGLA